MLRQIVPFEIVGALIATAWLPAALIAGNSEPQQPAIDANAPAISKLLDDPPRVLRGPGERPIGQRAERMARRTIRPATSPEARWYTNGFVALAAVLLLVAVLAWGIKRVAPQGRLGGTAIHVLSKTYLSSKQSLALVKVGNRVMLLGITPDHITHLTTIDDPIGVDLVAASADSSELSGAQFGRLLDTESTFYETDDNVEEHISSADFRTVRQTRRNLKDLLGRVKTLKDAARA